MIGRIVIGVALLVLGYYVGREVGRSEDARKELEQARNEGKEETEPHTKKPKTPR